MLISTKKELTSMVGALRRSNFLLFDIESTGFSPWTERLVSLQFWDGRGGVYVVDARRCDPVRLGKMIEPIFYEARLIIGHNLKFDLSWMQVQCAIDHRRLTVWDTLLAEQYILGLGMSEAKAAGKPLGLGYTAARHGLGEVSKEERPWFIGLDKRPEEWAADFPAEQIAYMENDVRILSPLFKDQKQELQERGMIEAIRTENAALLALVEAETTGIPIHVEKWRAFIEKKAIEAAALEEETAKSLAPPLQRARLKKYDAEMDILRAWKTEQERYLDSVTAAWVRDHAQAKPKKMGAGWGDYKTAHMQEWAEDNPRPKTPKIKNEINLGSPKQIVEALQEMGIEVESAKVSVLEDLEDEYPEIATLLLWRKSIKFVQSFGEKLLEKLNPVTGRIHPNFNPLGASSSRMSSNNPNFQQIPSKGDGKQIRACVIAPPGWKLIVADYSAQELRVLADKCKDANLLAFFENEANLRDDIHEATARLMFKVPEDQDITKELRGYAKTINYGIAYGMSPFALAGRLKISVDEAERLMNLWFEAYPGVKPWLDEQGVYTQEHLTSPTGCGWVRQFGYAPREPSKPYRGGPDDWREYNKAKKEYRRAMGRLRRQGMNTPIQGTAAAITKLALALFIKQCYTDRNGYALSGMRVIAVVHDEIVLLVPEENAQAASEFLADCMDQACKTILTRVRVPRTQAVISDHWTH